MIKNISAATKVALLDDQKKKKTPNSLKFK